MNDPQSTGETQAQELPAAGNSQVVSPSESESLDLRRRRLLRGAVGIAPVVLTLRSGALAASSCVAALQTGLATNSNKGFTTSPNSSVKVNTPAQVCISSASSSGCSANYIKHSTGTNIGNVVANSNGTAPNKLGCNGSNAANKTSIAVLSSGSATSWLNP